ncbi:hypothetical protein ACFWBR_17275 [Streptomyces sp. NPDC060006]|uniref:hypothetical protein n=1 Tax=unclassified Streptomyces TaxID=2593676 RepID=UPI00369A295E
MSKTQANAAGPEVIGFATASTPLLTFPTDRYRSQPTRHDFFSGGSLRSAGA